MTERLRFISRLDAGESMSELCREFGISRKTGYKLLERYRSEGAGALADRSRRPEHSPRATPAELVELLVAERKAHPTWGPRKLRVVLGRRHAGVEWPAESTVWAILKRHDLVPARAKRRQVPPHTAPLVHATGPNALWCADFKGQFRLGNGRYCYPLTVTDAYSRFLVGCVALESTAEEEAISVFSGLFRERGLPQAIRTDNGVPFASTSIQGLSRLGVVWRRLGIAHERIEKGHPEQNGRHERMHRTLKAETTRPAGQNLLQQQERFDLFQQEYNWVRPHQALEDCTPATAYRDSQRPCPKALPEPRYPLHDLACRVSWGGQVYIPHRRGPATPIYLSLVLADQLVGLRELEEGRWLVSFMRDDLGIVNLTTRRMES